MAKDSNYRCYSSKKINVTIVVESLERNETFCVSNVMSIGTTVIELHEFNKKQKKGEHGQIRKLQLGHKMEIFGTELNDFAKVKLKARLNFLMYEENTKTMPIPYIYSTTVL